MIFFEGIFGYLVFTIFYKWAVPWDGDVGVPGNPGPQPAPALLTLLINMCACAEPHATAPTSQSARCSVRTTRAAVCPARARRHRFMSPTKDISVPLYGIQCYTDCPTAAADGKCAIASILNACPISCLTDAADPLDPEGVDTLTLPDPDHGIDETKVRASEPRTMRKCRRIRCSVRSARCSVRR